MRAFVAVFFVAGVLAAPALADPVPQVIEVTAKKFEFNPSHIVLKKDVPVVLRLRSLDRKHGFKVPGLGLQTEIKPGKPTDVKFTPDKTGTFPFACSVFCGSGHEDMGGEIVVE
jgi:cytochrome c oxidase subunit 2